jgi:lipoprotein-anchoring transpeptidase ErfK/SrfK
MYIRGDIMVTLVNPFEILVKIDEHKLYLFENNRLIHTYPIAVGKPSTPTPRGIFLIKNKQENPGGRFGSRWLGLNTITGHYGIHGTNLPKSIGKNVTHGCIRMFNRDVIELAELVPVGTTVKII